MNRERQAIAALEAHALIAASDPTMAINLYVDWIKSRSESAFYRLLGVADDLAQVRLVDTWEDRSAYSPIRFTRTIFGSDEG